MSTKDKNAQKSINIQKALLSLQEKEYGDFQFRLNPNLNRTDIIGVRVPKIRTLARDVNKQDAKYVDKFLSTLPHKYYEENMLHSILLTFQKDFNTLIKLCDDFLPYVDNWAVCDTLSPKIFSKNKKPLFTHIKRWMKSKDEFTLRFAIKMLNDFYLNEEDFDPKYLKMVYDVKNEQYYVKMMKAWFFATALDKQWESAIEIFHNQKLDIWCHNKAIQKSRESRKISQENKDYLNTLKRK